MLQCDCERLFYSLKIYVYNLVNASNLSRYYLRYYYCYLSPYFSVRRRVIEVYVGPDCPVMG